MNSNRTQPSGGAPRRRKRKVALWAGAGFFGLALIGSVTSHPSTQPTAQVGSVASSPVASSPSHVAAALRLPSVSTRTTTNSPATSAAPVPAMTLTCPAGGTASSPAFGHDISAVAPYTVTIDYGDGDRYSNDDQHLNAVFTHRYKAAGSFPVSAVLKDASGQTVTSTCTYSWTAAAAAPRKAPVPATGGGASGNSYTNVDGNRISGPVSAAAPPPGATARCNDGTWSFSQHHQGTCSGHGGVAAWL